MNLWTETRLAPGHPLPLRLHPHLPGCPAQYVPPANYANYGYTHIHPHNFLTHPGPVDLILLDPGLIFPLTPIPKRLVAPRPTEVPLPLDVLPALLWPPPSITPSPSQVPLPFGLALEYLGRHPGMRLPHNSRHPSVLGPSQVWLSHPRTPRFPELHGLPESPPGGRYACRLEPFLPRPPRMEDAEPCPFWGNTGLAHADIHW